MIHEIFKKYVTNADAYVNWRKLEYGSDPDESFMRGIEEKLNISHQGKKIYREGVMIELQRHHRKGWNFSVHSIYGMKKAIEEVIATESNPKSGQHAAES